MTVLGMGICGEGEDNRKFVGKILDFVQSEPVRGHDFPVVE